MTQRNESQNQPIHPVSVGKRMLQGAAIGLVAIAFFLVGAVPDPDWSKLWMIRPLVVVPLAGALGGLFSYNMDHLRYEGGWRKILAAILSIAAYFVVLWLGIVLGLAGTMWD